MPPAKRHKTSPSTIFTDSSIEPIEFDNVGHPSVCVATINEDHVEAGCDGIYILKREYKGLENPWAPVTVKDCYPRYDFMDGRIPGLTLWKVLLNTAENWLPLSQKHGWEKRIPYVYVLKMNNGSRTTAHIKIGCSFDVDARMKTLQCGNPYKLTVMDKFRVSDELGDAASMFSCENKLHRHFYLHGGPFRPASMQHENVGGREWFAIREDKKDPSASDWLDAWIARFLVNISEQVDKFRRTGQCDPPPPPPSSGSASPDTDSQRGENSSNGGP